MREYSFYLETIGEYGVVKEVHSPIVVLDGLPHIRIYELVISENGALGQVFSLNKNSIEILLLSPEPVKVGAVFVRTNEFISIPVGNHLLGDIINPLGKSLLNTNQPADTTLVMKSLESKVKGIGERVAIHEPLITGVSLIDLMIPLGKGQKELILGDRKTGKTSFVLNVIKNQIKEGVVTIFATIGKKKSSIKKLHEQLVKEKLSEKIIMVATHSADSPSLIYLTPYTAMAVAEYFRDKGQNVLVVFDDLSTHAKFHREISLVASRFPGRESYPGDIFYIHAKLLERAGNFKHSEKKEVSISCMAIVQTIEGDLTGYIPTNIMGMTDGHIFFDSNVYFNGQRPAINTELSVTRVGKQTQSLLGKELNRELTTFFSSYRRMQNFSHFGAELSAKVKNTLEKGELLHHFFQQSYTEVVPIEIQLVIAALILTDAVKTSSGIDSLKTDFYEKYSQEEGRAFFKKLTEAKSLYDFYTQLSVNKEVLLKNTTNA